MLADRISSVITLITIAFIATAAPANQLRDPIIALADAAAALSNGSPDIAHTIALDAFRNAQTQDMHNRSARMIAASLAAQGQWTRAQIWLRRAANYAGNRAIADATKAEYQIVKRENPLIARFSFSISPSDNINRGIEGREFSLGGYDFVFPTSALAISGLEFTTTARLGYRLSSGARHKMKAYLDLFDQHYIISKSSQRANSDVKASDLTLRQVSLVLQNEFKLFDRADASMVRLRHSRGWYGGEPYRDRTGVEFAQEVSLNRQHALLLGASISNENGLGYGQPDAVETFVSATLISRQNSGDELSLGFGKSFYNADTETYTHETTGLSVQYTRAEPVFGTILSGDAQLTYKDYDEFSLSLDGRRDLSARLSASINFFEVTRFGFSPALTLTAERTWSNIALYDTEKVGASIEFVSNF